MKHFRIGSFGDAEISQLARSFATAHPFPHVTIPNAVCASPEDVLPSFPPVESPLWRQMEDAYQSGKMILSRFERIPEPMSSMLRELMEPAALEFVERVSGIGGLLPDPYLDGSGLHCSTPGGVMAPHTDIHINHRLGLYKRVIILVYLNPGWQESDGGCLELYDESDVRNPARTIVPTWGTMVIIRSDAHSVHGFSKPIAVSGDVRRALALYYYTSVDAPEYSGNELTHWRQHEAYWANHNVWFVMRLARLRMYRALSFGSKILAYLAYRTRPRTNRMR